MSSKRTPCMTPMWATPRDDFYCSAIDYEYERIGVFLFIGHVNERIRASRFVLPGNERLACFALRI